jgi:hypothetical protein
MPMSGLRTLLWVVSGLLPVVGCARDEVPAAPDKAGRIIKTLRGTSQSNLPVLNDDAVALGGELYLQVLDEPGASTGRLEWQSFPPPGEEVHMTLEAWQDLDRSPHGTRYLVGDDFTSFNVTLDLEGTHYLGTVLRFELYFDLLHGTQYASTNIRFVPVEGEGEPIEFALQLDGFADVSCNTTTQPIREVTFDFRYPDKPAPPACAAVFDQIRATPDDPEAPPLPYDIYASDVIDSGEGDDPSDPIAPFPFPD